MGYFMARKMEVLEAGLDYRVAAGCGVHQPCETTVGLIRRDCGHVSNMGHSAQSVLHISVPFVQEFPLPRKICYTLDLLSLVAATMFSISHPSRPSAPCSLTLAGSSFKYLGI
jgi:hypothetical protein